MFSNQMFRPQQQVDAVMIEGRNTSPVFDAEFTPMQQMDGDNDFIDNDDLMYSLIRKNKSSNQLDDGRQLF